MEREIFVKWIKINLLFFLGSFSIFLLLSLVLPEIFIQFGRSWGAYSNLFVPELSDQPSDLSLFTSIFLKNILILILYFVASLLFLAPLISLIAGAFYALGFMSFVDHFINGEILYSFWCSPVLILIEVSFVLFTISFASTLASDIFEIHPDKESILNYWKENWKKFIPKTKKKFGAVLSESKKELIIFILVILFLVLFGAWFEVMIASGMFS